MSPPPSRLRIVLPIGQRRCKLGRLLDTRPLSLAQPPLKPALGPGVVIPAGRRHEWQEARCDVAQGRPTGGAIDCGGVLLQRLREKRLGKP
jgi:hypothetical protein